MLRYAVQSYTLHGIFSTKLGFRRMKERTVIVSIIDNTHWSIAILSNHVFLKFDYGVAKTLSFYGGS